MIIGHGIDLVEIDRVSNIYAKYKENFISKYFINDQLKKIDSNLLANNFAIKEAFSKSIGLGFRSPCYPNNIVVSRDTLGKPVISCRKDGFCDLKMIHKGMRPIIYHYRLVSFDGGERQRVSQSPGLDVLDVMLDVASMQP